MFKNFTKINAEQIIGDFVFHFIHISIVENHADRTHVLKPITSLWNESSK